MVKVALELQVVLDFPDRPLDPVSQFGRRPNNAAPPEPRLDRPKDVLDGVQFRRVWRQEDVVVVVVEEC